MAKEKKIKEKRQRDSGFNIAYRIVTALTAAATFPIMIFSSLFYLAYSIPLWPLISKDSTDTGASFLKASIYELMTVYSSDDSYFKFDLSAFSGELAPLKKPLIVVLSLFGALCVIALVIIILAAFTRKKLPVIISAALGSGVLIAIPFAFRYLEAPLADGTVGIDTFLHTGLENMMNLVVQFDFLKVGEAYALLWVVFAGILVWTGAVMLVNTGDAPNKKKADNTQ